MISVTQIMLLKKIPLMSPFLLLNQDSATKEKSAGEPKHFDDRPSTPDSAADKSADELTPFPDRILAPYSVQFEKVNLSKDKFVESPPLSTRMIEKADVVTNSPTNGDISIYHPLSGSDVKLDGNPSVFGDLFNKKMEFLLVESGMHIYSKISLWKAFETFSKGA